MNYKIHPLSDVQTEIFGKGTPMYLKDKNGQKYILIYDEPVPR